MMSGALAELLHAWHDFYTLIGTAAATLIGLMFVAASIASSYLTERNKAGVQTFFTPTVAHFAAVLFICIVLSAPMSSWRALGGLLLGIGASGLGYSTLVWVRMGRRGLTATIDLSDRLCYALAPLACHVLIAISAIMLLVGDEGGLLVLAIGAVTLLLAGVRNAWDITSWVVMRTGSQ
jgi:hypothetical protein